MNLAALVQLTMTAKHEAQSLALAMQLTGLDTKWLSRSTPKTPSMKIFVSKVSSRQNPIIATEP
ncbi:MAG: hypothetical protein ONA90_06905 [candidate division KSB1 bacterium]|nr:hypothetical protein [candidate division KSB1 bacterium]